MNQHQKPPQWAVKLLEWRCPDELLEEIQGDLQELFEERITEVGERKARKEYILSVVGYLRPFAFKSQPSKYPSSNYIGMFQNYIMVALRSMKRNRIFSLINISGLSIGLACCMLIFLYTKDELSYDHFHAESEHLYRITYQSLTPSGSLEYKHGSTGFLQGPIFTAQIPEIKTFVRYQNMRKDIKLGTEVISQEVYLADTNFFSVFSFPLLKGNPRKALLDKRSIVISESMAQKHFGTIDALGKSLYVKEGDIFEPYLVTGIAKQCPQNSSIRFDVVMPIEEFDKENKERWLITFLNTFVVLDPKASISAVETKINKVYQTHAKEAIQLVAEKYGMKSKRIYALQPFTQMHLSEDLPADNGLTGSSKPVYSYILSGIAFFILLIACINFVNLTIARSLKRAKEIGIRKVVGGDKKQLIVQFMGESYVFCFAAFGLALGLVELLLPLFNELSGKALSLSYLFDLPLVAGYSALFVVTGLLSGFYPSLILSSYNPVQTLYNRFRLSGKNYLQKSLVVVQFALASFLIVASCTIYSQFAYLTTKDLGYEDTNVISIHKWGLKREQARILKEELLKNPSILAVTPKNGGRFNTAVKVSGGQQVSLTCETVDATYLPFFKIPLVAGRNFSPDLPSDSTESVIVNETFVRQALWQDPIGQVVDFWYNENEKYRVIGVVKDYHFTALNQEIGPQLFYMKPGNSYGKVFIKIKPNTATESLQHIEQTFKKLFPMDPYGYSFLEEDNLKAYEAEAKWKQMIWLATLLTIFIACIGLFGLATLSAQRRRKEIGIRKVLGASVSNIFQLLSSDFLKLVGFSFLIAFPLAVYVMKQWLENYPYRIELNIWIFLFTALLALLIAAITISFQSIKAARTNPAANLRTE